MTPRYYLGVDSGGTKTRALAADHEGRIVGAGSSGSANRNHYTRDQIKENLRSALIDAMRGMEMASVPKTIFVGTSGVSTHRDCQEIVEIVREIPEIDQNDHVAVENDTVVGLSGGLSGRPGMALIAGTGSVCLGVNSRGERHLCGGWGALADDAGSAPWLGQKALTAAIRAHDGRSAPTALQQIVFDSLGLREPREFIGRVHHPEHGLDRSGLGDLAPLVIGAFRDGDTAAIAIVNDAAAELSLLVRTTAHRLFGTDSCDLILVGGLALSGDPFQTVLTERIALDTPSVRICEPDMTPVHGAVLEALRSDGIAWTPELIANVARPQATALDAES